MPPCPPVAALPGAGTVVGRGSVIQAAAANCYQPNGTGAANLNDLYYMDFGAPTAAAAMYHQKAVGNKNGNSKKPKKYGGVGRPSVAGSPGAVQQQTCPATGPKRKSREGKQYFFVILPMCKINLAFIMIYGLLMLYYVLMVLVFFLYGRFHDVPLGIFIETIAKLWLLPKVYQMVKPGKGRFQVGRLQSGVQALGRA